MQPDSQPQSASQLSRARVHGTKVGETLDGINLTPLDVYHRLEGFNLNLNTRAKLVLEIIEPSNPHFDIWIQIEKDTRLAADEARRMILRIQDLTDKPK